jgi:hypothetical protein
MLPAAWSLVEKSKSHVRAGHSKQHLEGNAATLH